MTLTTPKIQVRNYNQELYAELLSKGLHPVVARVLSSRPKPENSTWQQMLEPKLSYLSNPQSMADMDKASDRLAEAIIQQEVIGIETDHDCDGQTAHAVIFHNLVKHFKHPTNLIRSYIGHRLEEGYGLSDRLTARILLDKIKPSLIVTADNGSSDELRIAKLLEAGIETIVTDHHQLPISGPPKSAYACLNPTRDDCNYGDKFIAGCMVAWLLMCVTRDKLITLNYLPKDAPKLSDSLDFVAVGTVADCVSMARSHNNRAIVNYGLQLINKASKPCWQALKFKLKKHLTSSDLGFKVGPLLNSDGRLSSAFGSVTFLLAENFSEAQEWLIHLEQQNSLRKNIQAKVTHQGMEIANSQVAAGRYSICVFLSDGHSGVHGISASRIKDNFGRPTVFLAPKQNEENIITGSIRGIENFSCSKAISWIVANHPDLLIAGGGHKGAGGVSLRREDLSKFSEAFEQAARLQLVSEDLGPVILTDGDLLPEWIDVRTLEQLKLLEPYGREFETPLFELCATLTNLKVIGDGTHARVEFDLGEQQKVSGVWFGFRPKAEDPIPVNIGDKLKSVVALQGSDFSGIKKCELQVVHIFS